MALPDFPGSSSSLGFHQMGNQVQLHVAALEMYGCTSISSVQRRKGGREELFHKSLIIKLIFSLLRYEVG